jgi:hypothetical protein
MDIGIPDDGAEFLERDLSVLVFVSEQNGLVDDLLELRVLQVVPHHHLQHLRYAYTRIQSGRIIAQLSNTYNCRSVYK